MKAVWSWLTELCELPRPITAEEGAAALTGVGLEVEDVTRLGDDFEGVVIAEVASRAPHPNADKLSLVQVITEAGGTPTDVVCGAPNVPDPGGRVLWARPGSKLPGGFTIGTKKLKGVESAGMLCSAAELGLGDDHDGIVVLGGDDARAPLGSEARDTLRLRDVVFDISVPANRPDCLGHLGLARELAALFGGRLCDPDRDLAQVTSAELAAEALCRVDIADPEACPRYTARIVDGLTVAPSPLWLQQRLRAVGVRPISNLVDVTNYVMFELCQPLHAFDADKVAGAHITVRRARPSEAMTTLDDVDRELEPADIVICDDDGPVALGGVMGGARTEVGAQTRRILLESATFEPGSIRKSSRRLGLLSESSYRFERGVDAEGCERASARAALLLARLGGGTVAAGVVDAYPRPPAPARVAMRVSRCRELTGVDLDRSDAEAALRALGLEVGGAGDLVEATIPSHRSDLSREVDLIEEVIRLRGFHNVPATLPAAAVVPRGDADRRPEIAREALVAAGFAESISFGFTSPARIAALGLAEDDRRSQPVRIDNPMTVEQSVMRTSLLSNLLAAVAHNRKHGAADIALFELGSVFLRGAPGQLPDEPRRVAAVLAGHRPGWLAPGADVDVFDLKGALDALLEALLGTAGVTIEPSCDVPHLHPGVAAVVRDAGGTEIGTFGEVHPDVRERFDIDVACFAFDLDLDAFPLPSPRSMQPVPRFPAVTRDVSFFVDAAVPSSQMTQIIESCREPLVAQVAVLEDYRDPAKVPSGKKGMLWSITYRAADRTLTDAEVDAAHRAIEDRLLGELSATRR